jgi:hypothetical protein
MLLPRRAPTRRRIIHLRVTSMSAACQIKKETKGASAASDARRTENSYKRAGLRPSKASLRA